jgi:2-dehydro-3-deoxygalactonokinase
MEPLTRFLSCDWGTTAFRLRLVELEGFRIIAESESKQGVRTVNDEWVSSSKSAAERMGFYTTILTEHIRKLEEQTGGALKDVPVIISGMASSNIGMLELPYKEMPFALDGSDLLTRLIPQSEQLTNRTLLISGVRTEDDVMRGEEVQVVGCAEGRNTSEQVVIHPGTHCKHIILQEGRAVSFRTYMTGEMFALLGSKSLLAASIEGGGDFDSQNNRVHFDAGVHDAAKHHLLHALFLVRTGDLFKLRTKQEAFYYLSGLLIGAELRDFPNDYRGGVILAGEEALIKQYKAAMDISGISERSAQVVLKDADAITLAGQYAVYLNQKSA